MDLEKYTRITTVLAPFAGYGAIPKEIIAKAADRGTRAHNAIHSHMSHLGTWGVDEDIIGYVQSAEKFFPKIGNVLWLEERFFCDKLLLTGQCDLIAEYDGEVTLIDWKTSSKVNPTWSAQAGGYFYVGPKKFLTRAIFVKLDKNGGEPEIHNFDNVGACIDEFMACYDMYNKYFKNNKLEIFE